MVLSSMMHVDYKLSDIDCTWNDKLGQGAFAEVFYGVLKSSNGDRLDVALKRSRDAIDRRSITDISFQIS
jgi:hypothetical protein